MALPKDELEVISKKLTFDPDYTRFRSVCKSWRSAAPKRPQLPWLISYHRTDSDESTFLVNFYQFSFETNKITRIPELSDSLLLSSFIDNSTDCIGSSHGWLALFNRGTSSLVLYNPLTNSTIDLPNLQNCFKNAFFSSRIDSFYLTSDPGESLADCFVVLYCYSKFLYCKVGSSGWIEVTPDPESEYKLYSNIHFCFYHGKLFIASNGDVFVYEFGRNSNFCKIVSVSLDDDDAYASECEFEGSYLVESNGDLLFVLVYCIEDFDSNYFRVIKLEFECLLVKLVELKSLGNKAIFLSQKIAFSLTSSKYPGCKENSIYKTLITSEEARAVQMLKVFDFEEYCSVRVIDDFAPSDVVSIFNSNWFSPSLLK